METLRFDIVKTTWGYLALAASRHGLRHVVLPRSSRQEAFHALTAVLQGEKLRPDPEDALLTAVAGQMRGYFRGRPIAFACKLDYNVATVFQREVWSVTRTLAYGQTRSYGWVAECLGAPGARRAVGQALNANPLPLVVPCHRVTAARGRLGGFGGGPELKSRLLQLEGTVLT